MAKWTKVWAMINFDKQTNRVPESKYIWGAFLIIIMFYVVQLYHEKGRFKFILHFTCM